MSRPRYNGRVEDVLVVGGGPAGRALAAACVARGLRTTLVDPAPDAPWRATYGAWLAELPADLPAPAVAARARGRAVALGEHDLGWEYAVLDVPALRRHLDAGLAGATVRTGRAIGTAGTGTVALADGTRLRARVVVDAGGRHQPLRRELQQSHFAATTSRQSGFAAISRPATPAEQTAYGVVVGEAAAAPLIAPGEALFMDWRPDHNVPGPPTFLYAVPRGDGTVLLEETSLARRPGLAMPALRDRLLARLAAHGITPPDDAPVERVHFPLDSPRHRTPGVLGFGAAAPLVHPASGFSVATALALAPPVAAAIATHLPVGGAQAALAAARRVVWPRGARAVHRFRRIGLEALLRMPPQEVPAFFEVFFGLPEPHRWAYLTARADLRATAATMGALFARADPALRMRLVGPALLPPAPAVP
ncbi:lycopene cyclase family protein [Pseudonocardia nigra]|uniref:lycopene cyclase family protein n=1 Tax=Pseudonocardia nigra TaxID=1921578 RepID=UPI001C602142|nr:lycopene cyclase family protein [Pseudonocardia nigra]